MFRRIFKDKNSVASVVSEGLVEETLQVMVEFFRGRLVEVENEVNRSLMASPNALGADIRHFGHSQVSGEMMSGMSSGGGDTYVVAITYRVPREKGGGSVKGLRQIKLMEAETLSRLVSGVNQFAASVAANKVDFQFVQNKTTPGKGKWVAQINFTA